MAGALRNGTILPRTVVGNSAAARDPAGKDLRVESREDGPPLLVRFPNDPAGVTIEIRWAK